MIADTLVHYLRGTGSAAFVSLLAASSLVLPHPAFAQAQAHATPTVQGNPQLVGKTG